MNQVLVPGPEPRKLTSTTSELFGRYRILRTLAFGGMAQIFLAIDNVTGRKVVVKKILPQFAANPEFVQFFIHEGRLGQRLRHPNLVETLDAGQVGDTPFIALEYLRGSPAIELLRAAARAHVELPLGAAVRIVADTARGLHFAHLANDDDGRPLGVVHRDVTPHNLFLCAGGDTKVLDFGIAKAASQLHQTRTGTIKGKFAYLAPEQIRGQSIDRRVDVFALGIVLHELLTLKPLFRGSNDGETLQRVLELEVPAPEKVRPGVPPGLGAVALRALQRDPDRRLPSAEALADSIEAVAAAECIDASPEVVAELLHELCPQLEEEEAVPLLPDDVTQDPPPESPRHDAGARLVDEVPSVSLGRATGAQAVRDPSGEQPAGQLVTGQRERGRTHAGRAALLVGAGVLLVGFALTSKSCVERRHASAPAALPSFSSREPEAAAGAPAHVVAPERAAATPALATSPAPRGAPSLAPSPARSSEATLRVEASGSPTFVVDGHVQRPAADGLLHLAPGRHTVVVSSAQLSSPRSLAVELREGEAATRAVRAGHGSLRVAATPWAEVLVDGRSLGTTPFPPVELGEGSHTVTLKNVELGVTTRRRVVIAPNRETLLKADLFSSR